MVNIQTLLKYFGQISLARMAYVYAKTGRRNVLVFRNVHLRMGKAVRVTGDGRLMLSCQWPLGRYMPSQLVVRDEGEIELNGLFRMLSGHVLWIEKGARLTLGSGYANNGLRLGCHVGIEIGHGVAIAENVTIRDSDNHRTGRNTSPNAPIRIGDRVWIGMNSTILKGVTIGHDAIIAAGSVVIRDVPPNCLVAGVPARVKKTDVRWSDV